MYGNSIPVGTVGAILFEYIQLSAALHIDARIQRALQDRRSFLEPLPASAAPRNSVDNHVKWLKSRPGSQPEMESATGGAKSPTGASREGLAPVCTVRAGVHLVDAQGHGNHFS